MFFEIQNYMNGEDRIYKKLLEHDKRFDQNDKRWAENDKRWAENDKRWERNDKCTDRIIKKLLEHDERFEQTSTSKEVQELRNYMSRSFDEMMLILKRLDEDRVFTARWIERVEKEGERLAKESTRLIKDNAQHEKDIKFIKMQLKIA